MSSLPPVFQLQSLCLLFPQGHRGHPRAIFLASLEKMSNSILFNNRNYVLNPLAFTTSQAGPRHHTAAPPPPLEWPWGLQALITTTPPAQGQALPGTTSTCNADHPVHSFKSFSGSELQEQPKSWRAQGPHALGPPRSALPPPLLKAFLGQGAPPRV